MVEVNLQKFKEYVLKPREGQKWIEVTTAISEDICVFN